MSIQPEQQDLAVNPPKQERSRLAWNRVLDAGVQLLEEGGFDAFTIGAVCERAGVSIPSIYARTKSKEALFLAVYEHKLQQIAADEVTAFENPERWRDMTTEQLVRGATSEVAARFFRSSAFLRAIIIRSSGDAEVRRRGALYTGALGSRFTTLVLQRRDEITYPDPEAVVNACFRVLFSTLITYVNYGPQFISERALSDDELVAELGDIAVKYLLK